jgi:hypothetical protein
MRKHSRFLLSLRASLLLLTGCATVQSPPLPGQTIAGQAGREAIIEQIQWLEKANGRRECEWRVINTRFIEQEMRTTIEHWVVEGCGLKTTYKIRITELQPGVIKYAVTYPKPADLNR